MPRRNDKLNPYVAHWATLRGGQMGFMDWFKKGEKEAAENKETVTGGIDKVADVADDKTGGQYTEQIDQGAEKAKDYVEGLDEEN